PRDYAGARGDGMIALLLMLLTAQNSPLADSNSRASEAERMERASVELKEAEDALDWALARRIDNARINDQNPNAEPRSPSREANVRKAQEAWLAYRDAHCDAQYLAPVAKDLEPVNRIWCRTRLTKARAAELTYDFTVD